MKDNLTIIVPLYNEEENIDRLNKELDAFLKISLVDTQVLFINDGSSDNSEELIKKKCKVNDKFKLII